MFSREQHLNFLCPKAFTHRPPTIFYQHICLEESHHNMIRYNSGTFCLQFHRGWKGRRIRSICTGLPFPCYENPLEGSTRQILEIENSHLTGHEVLCLSYKRTAILQVPPRQNILSFQTDCNSNKIFRHRASCKVSVLIEMHCFTEQFKKNC